MLLFKTSEYTKWYLEQPKQTRYVIEARMKRLEEDDHWGITHSFDGMVELKWRSGLRIYTARIGKMKVIVLLGGNKNGQNRDIKKAKKILEKIKDTYFN